MEALTTKGVHQEQEQPVGYKVVIRMDPEITDLVLNRLRKLADTHLARKYAHFESLHFLKVNDGNDWSGTGEITLEVRGKLSTGVLYHLLDKEMIQGSSRIFYEKREIEKIFDRQ